MRLFAPLYLSNECINNCQYCGFSRDNPILRVTLIVDEVVTEAQHLARQGFRQILLVAGEHPKFVSGDYLAQCVRALSPDFSSISIEVGPMLSQSSQVPWQASQPRYFFQVGCLYIHGKTVAFRRS